MSKFVIELDDSKYPEHLCLAWPNKVHEAHDWVYTASGGGHQMSEWDETERERNQKWWHCPGRMEAMKYLCPECWPKTSGPWLCDVAHYRGMVAIPRFTPARHLFETDAWSRGMA